jgi:chromate transporter
MTALLLQIAQVFGMLSLLAVGGGNAIIPDMQRIVVDQHHWMPAREFLDLFAITRATPGPGSTIVLLIGQKLAGLPGALIGGLAMYIPSSALVFAASRIWRTRAETKAIKRLERALAPIAIGLIFASGVVLIRSTEHGWLAFATTAVAAVLLTVTDTNPLILLAAGAAVSVGAGLL